LSSKGESVFQTVTCEHATTYASSLAHAGYLAIGGQAATIITSAGGAAITLAGSAGGKVTSFAGSQYTVATAAIGSAASSASASHNAAASAYSFGFTPSIAVALIAVVASAFVGALITI
jgi:hypothetical protein